MNPSSERTAMSEEFWQAVHRDAIGLALSELLTAAEDLFKLRPELSELTIEKTGDSTGVITLVTD